MLFFLPEFLIIVLLLLPGFRVPLYYFVDDLPVTQIHGQVCNPCSADMTWSDEGINKKKVTWGESSDGVVVISPAAFTEVGGLRGAFLLSRRFARLHIAAERTADEQNTEAKTTDNRLWCSVVCIRWETHPVGNVLWCFFPCTDLHLNAFMLSNMLFNILHEFLVDMRQGGGKSSHLHTT